MFLKKAIIILMVLTLMFAVVAEPVSAYSRACDQFASCHSPGDCAWWGVRCASTDMSGFMGVVDDWFW